VTLPISNAGASDRATETISLGDSPHRHESAVAPTGHAETIRIDRILFYRGIDAGHDVAKIAMAKIFHVRASEFLTLAVTSARIREQHVITACRESGDNCSRHSNTGRPVRRRRARWSTVDQNHHWISFCGLHFARRKQPALIVKSLIGPLDAFCFSPSHRLRRVVVG